MSKAALPDKLVAKSHNLSAIFGMTKLWRRQTKEQGVSGED